MWRHFGFSGGQDITFNDRLCNISKKYTVTKSHNILSILRCIVFVLHRYIHIHIQTAYNTGNWLIISLSQSLFSNQMRFVFLTDGDDHRIYDVYKLFRGQ